jgi:hypothetical protein
MKLGDVLKKQQLHQKWSLAETAARLSISVSDCEDLELAIRPESAGGTFWLRSPFCCGHQCHA